MQQFHVNIIVGCLQYFYGTNQDGSVTGQIKSFNYDQGWHLASQNQKICIRRESGFCAICYSQVSGNSINPFLGGLWNYVSRRGRGVEGHYDTDGF